MGQEEASGLNAECQVLDASIQNAESLNPER
jgi:hypothetical protein